MIPADKIKKLLKSLPSNPGVYIMHDKNSVVIYVGKAKALRDRVSSYFLKTNIANIKISAMLEHLDYLEYIITDSEIEALVLESNLIKKHMPYFNVLLKDDKHYPYIKIDINQQFPSIQIVRKKIKDGSRYFGPFPQSSIIKPSLKFITKYFPIRVCHGELNSRKSCLNFHIKRCLGPCKTEINQEIYNQYVKEVVFFLEGKHEKLKSELESRMKEFAALQQFEQAAVYRDRLYSLQKITQRQKIILDGAVNLDVLAFDWDGGIIYFCIMVYRDGYLLNQHNYNLSMSELDSEEDVITQGLLQHYEGPELLPQEILLPESLKKFDRMVTALTLAFAGKVLIKFPRIGAKYDLLNFAAKNVRKFSQVSGFLPRVQREGEKLQEALGLATIPVTILGFDISHLSGTNTVASAVYFEYGKPKKKFYKRFGIKSVINKADDFKSMQEVVSRYFAKFPGADIILIDGGKGQLNSALNALIELKIKYKCILGLAKRDEEIYLPGKEEPLKLPKNSPALHMLQRVRDEAHRFAIVYQKSKRSKTSVVSIMDEIPGVSKERRKKLLFYFGSLEAVKKASVDDIINIPGFGRKLAQKIYNVFH